MSTLVWFRQDLRLDDNPALSAAIARGGAVIPVYLWTPTEEGDWPPGAASCWWLHQSLAALDADLRTRGSRLILRIAGGAPSRRALDLLRELLRETKADAVYWNRRYEPAAVARDTAVKAELLAAGISAESFNSALLYEPWTVANQEGKPLRVFTPFWRRCLALDEPSKPKPAPRSIDAPPQWPSGVALAALKLEPTIDWAGGLRAEWTPGERGAHTRLKLFAEEVVADYAAARDLPGTAGTSRLSPHLHFGEISPRRIWHAIRAGVSAERITDKLDRGRAGDVYLRELGWREFAHHLLFHFPATAREPLREDFAAFPWRNDARSLSAWQRGRTGYPLVDAGMRELWATGWMHNRVRMVVASFLVKHLLLTWQEGTQWFWNTLVDADLANNTLGWQWTAGCGADAAPYFRVFNPVLQGEKFDPRGAYVRRWAPELSKLSDEFIHRPWQAPPPSLAAAGVKLGETYARPIVEHAQARQRALDAFSRIRGVAGK